MLCQRVKLTPLDYSGEIEVISSLDAQVDNLGVQHWNCLRQDCEDGILSLELETKATRIQLGLSQKMVCVGAMPTINENWNLESHPAQRLVLEAEQGKPYCINKLTSIFTSRDVEKPLVEANLHLVRNMGFSWEQIRTAHDEAWRAEWDLSDIVIKSQDNAQLMVRFSIYQMLICAPRHDDRVSIGAKTLSGYGYRGHVFWDTEIFLLPFFSMTQPKISKNLLNYRWNNLEGARKKAKAGGFQGAQYPWESAGEGTEVTPTWVPHFADPTKLVRIWTGDIEVHITADVAYAIHQYWKMTGDDDFMIEKGIPIILETAKFWSSRLEWNETRQKYELTDVIGPDENHEHVDNNAFTNYLVRWHLQQAVEMFQWLKEFNPEQFIRLCAELNLSVEMVAVWKQQAEEIYFPALTSDGVIEQFEGFFDLEYIDISKYAGRTQSFQEIFGIGESNDNQIAKQADVVMLMHLFRDHFPKEVVEANYDYYNQRADHEYGSSLGPSMFSLVASQIGRKKDAYEHFLRSAKADLYDIRGNIKDGIHAASLGGIWQDVVLGFAGLNVVDGKLTVTPDLPEPWESLSFQIVYQGNNYQVDIDKKNNGVIRCK